MTKNAFIFSWDQYGIESIVPITEYENFDKQNLMRILKDEKPKRNPLNHIVHHLILRAKFNQQRHYEIYLIAATDGITTNDIRNMFEASPQTAADTIRRLGHCYYSDRVDKNKILIT